MFNDYEIKNYENEVSKIEELTSHCKKTSIKLKELKVGQTVIINFIPYSQKYIYILTPKYGKIVQVSESNNLVDYKIQTQDSENKIQTEYLFHPGVSDYGESLGYDYSIKLVETPDKPSETNS
jgi:hypothetical protein